MICANCKSAVEEGDRFCPKCGGSVTAAMARPQVATGMPAAPHVVEARTQQGTRVTEMRVPIAEGGRKYIGLTTAARLLIRTASIVRMLGFVVALLTVVSGFMLTAQQDGGPVFYVFAVLAGIFIAIVSWITALILTILGELMLVTVDIEDALRRHT